MPLATFSLGDLVPETWLSDVATAINAIPSQLATLWPVGSVYINAAVATNPAALLGFGTWVAFGTGRVLVGVDTGQAEFNTLGATGGEKTHTLTTAELASHSHGVTDPTHAHATGDFGAANAASGAARNALNGGSTTGASATGITINNAGSDTPHNNLQPFVTVYMWRRTA
jgi:hypothetical protein